MPHIGGTEEDPATTGEATPASVIVRPIPTTEDDTTAAGQPMLLIGAIEDHPPMEEDPASTAEGDITALADVSPTSFADIDEAAGRPTPLTEGDTTAPAEVSPTAFADVDEAAGQLTSPTGVTKDLAPTVEDPTTTVEGAPASVIVATTEGDTTAAAEVSSSIVAELDDPIAAIDLAAMAIDDD
ncbi:hypothetical protein E2562_006844 [Oryza meyeriana var. granulata]|uniref:Uncharacterized protein n=1 Tax=Oryza meyeriana var. granulata TaxID=110450 RepID=A0A6G1C528_9ORYZ|nr:hypothetical protein E2562_006844 [Oryza meyeriana var. granulata]